MKNIDSTLSNELYILQPSNTKTSQRKYKWISCMKTHEFPWSAEISAGGSSWFVKQHYTKKPISSENIADNTMNVFWMVRNLLKYALLIFYVFQLCPGSYEFFKNSNFWLKNCPLKRVQSPNRRPEKRPRKKFVSVLE